MPEPEWLTNAPPEMHEMLRAGYEKYGDDRKAIAEWFRQLADYKAFWDRVDSREDPLR